MKEYDTRCTKEDRRLCDKAKIYDLRSTNIPFSGLAARFFFRLSVMR